MIYRHDKGDRIEYRGKIFYRWKPGKHPYFLVTKERTRHTGIIEKPGTYYHSVSYGNSVFKSAIEQGDYIKITFPLLLKYFSEEYIHKDTLKAILEELINEI